VSSLPIVDPNGEPKIDSQHLEVKFEDIGKNSPCFGHVYLDVIHVKGISGPNFFTGKTKHILNLGVVNFWEGNDGKGVIERSRDIVGGEPMHQLADDARGVKAQKRIQKASKEGREGKLHHGLTALKPAKKEVKKVM